MGSLIDELQRREATVRAQAEELRGQIAYLAEQLAGVEAQLARLVTAREVVDEVLDRPAGEIAPVSVAVQAAVPAGPVRRPAAAGCWRCRRGGRVLGLMCCRGITGIWWRWRRMRGGRCGRCSSRRRRG